MDMANDIGDALRLLAALGLATLAVSTALNRHRGTLHYMGRVMWNISRALVWVLTFGRVKVPGLTRRAKMRQKSRWRKWRDARRGDDDDDDDDDIEEPVWGTVGSTAGSAPSLAEQLRQDAPPTPSAPTYSPPPAADPPAPAPTPSPYTAPGPQAPSEDDDDLDGPPALW